jgi:hypothetical protein
MQLRHGWHVTAPEPAGISIANMRLKSILMYAYDARFDQISGGPAWIDQDPRYTAKSAGDGVSIFAALQNRLGLKLRSRRGPVVTFVVQHAERPENYRTKSANDAPPTEQTAPWQRLSLHCGPCL